MEKPRMKQSLVVDNVFKDHGVIYFTANEHLAALAADFGLLSERTYRPSHYSLTIDPRYDFDEVVTYLESLG